MFNYLVVLKLHDEVLRHYGGALGIRDNNLLDSALHRPFQTFASEDLYTSIHEKAAAICKTLLFIILLLMGIKELVSFV